MRSVQRLISYKHAVLVLALACGFVPGLHVSPATASEKQEAVELNNEGMKAIEKGDLELAIEKFEQAVRLNPAYVLAKKNLSMAYGNKAAKLPSMPMDALDQFHKKLNVKPDTANTHAMEDPFVRAKFDEVSKVLDPNYKPGPITIPPETAREASNAAVDGYDNPFVLGLCVLRWAGPIVAVTGLALVIGLVLWLAGMRKDAPS